MNVNSKVKEQDRKVKSQAKRCQEEPFFGHTSGKGKFVIVALTES